MLRYLCPYHKKEVHYDEEWDCFYCPECDKYYEPEEVISEED